MCRPLRPSICDVMSIRDQTACQIFINFGRQNFLRKLVYQTWVSWTSPQRHSESAEGRKLISTRTFSVSWPIWVNFGIWDIDVCCCGRTIPANTWNDWETRREPVTIPGNAVNIRTRHVPNKNAPVWYPIICLLVIQLLSSLYRLLLSTISNKSCNKPFYTT